jgi:3-(3-hydroxy-phenyl)propionate hydroxylase
MLDAATLTVLEDLVRGPVPVEPLIVAGQAQARIGRAAALHDCEGLVRKRYDLTPGAAYLFRPDQHVGARWRAWQADDVRRAVHRALGRT